MKASAQALVVLSLLMSCAAWAETKVLFIGNSFTIGGTASVPVIFDRLAQAGGHADPTTVMRAVGGMDYQYFAGDATTLNIIKSEPWDFVVLQNYSTEPTHFVDSTHSLADHFTYGRALYNQVMANNPATQVILFETWSRAAAHSYITGVSSPTSFASTAEMQAELRTNYQALADSLNQDHPQNPQVQVAPVGTAWELAGGLRSSTDPLFVDLHGSDNYHGDDDGYYLSAAVLYAQIFGESPAGLSSDVRVSSLNLSRNVSAQHLENVAWRAVEPVPEPGSVFLLSTAAAFLGMRRQRRSGNSGTRRCAIKRQLLER